MKLRAHCRGLCLMAALAVPAPALSAPVYTITLLPSGFTPQDMNNAGQIVGNTRDEAWIWSDSGTVNLSQIVPNIQVFAINNRGEVAGSYTTGSSAFIFSDGRIRDIGTPPGLNFATPRAFNDKGQLAGTAGNFPGETSRAFFYDGSMTAIGTFGGDQGDGYGLNNSGTVVGSTALPTPPDSMLGERRAFVYRDGVLLPVEAPGAIVPVAFDINNSGAVVGGLSYPASNTFLPYIYTDGVLDSLDGPNGWAQGINDKGAVVGTWAASGATRSQAFLYSEGRMTNLNDLATALPGWTLAQADDINDAGQILATVCSGIEFDCRPVRLDPVPAIPEPGSAALLLGGLVVLAGAQARIRHCRAQLARRNLTWI